MRSSTETKHKQTKHTDQEIKRKPAKITGKCRNLQDLCGDFDDYNTLTTTVDKLTANPYLTMETMA